MMRNPRDICCSLLNHFQVTDNYTGSLDTLVDTFLADTGSYYGPYFVHALSYWNKRHLPNLFICWYEELQGEFATTIKKLAKFLELSISDDDIPELKEYVSFDKMKKNDMVNMDDTITVSRIKISDQYLNPFSSKFLEIFTKNSFFNFRTSNGARCLLFELNCMKIHSSCSEFCPLSKKTSSKILNFNSFEVIVL